MTICTSAMCNLDKSAHQQVISAEAADSQVNPILTKTSFIIRVVKISERAAATLATLHLAQVILPALVFKTMGPFTMKTEEEGLLIVVSQPWVNLLANLWAHVIAWLLLIVAHPWAHVTAWLLLIVAHPWAHAIAWLLSIAAHPWAHVMAWLLLIAAHQWAHVIAWLLLIAAHR